MRSLFEQKRQIAERYLLKFNYLKKLSRRTEEKIYLSAVQCDGLPHGNNISNPTQRIALQDVLDEQDRAWLDLISDYYGKADSRRRIMIDGRNEAEELAKVKRGRPGWTDYVGQKYCEYMADAHNVEMIMPHRNTLNMWWNTIVSDVVVLAMTNKIFK